MMTLTLRILSLVLAAALGLGSAACGPGRAAMPPKNGLASESYVTTFVRELGSEDPTVRRNAAGALGCLGPAARRAAPALQCATTDPDPDVRRFATASLRQVSGASPDGPPSESSRAACGGEGGRALASRADSRTSPSQGMR